MATVAVATSGGVVFREWPEPAIVASAMIAPADAAIVAVADVEAEADSYMAAMQPRWATVTWGGRGGCKTANALYALALAGGRAWAP